MRADAVANTVNGSDGLREKSGPAMDAEMAKAAAKAIADGKLFLRDQEWLAAYDIQAK